MAIFPNSTGNFIMTKGTQGNFDFYLRSNNAPINISGYTIYMLFQHKHVLSYVQSFQSGVTSARLSVLNTTSGAVRFQPAASDLTLVGDYKFCFALKDSNNKISFVPEHMRYTCRVIDLV